jgi:hypothetical protein
MNDKKLERFIRPKTRVGSVKCQKNAIHNRQNGVVVATRWTKMMKY